MYWEDSRRGARRFRKTSDALSTLQEAIRRRHGLRARAREPDRNALAWHAPLRFLVREPRCGLVVVVAKPVLEGLARQPLSGILASLPSRFDAKAMRVPSGETAGEDSREGSRVSGLAREPLAAIT